MAFETDHVVLHGFRHRYTRWKPEAPALPPVVALHGFGTTGYRTYRYGGDRLRAAGLPLFAPDLLGFGGTDAPDRGYSLHYYADLTAAFADALGLERPVLMGHSLGGKIAAATVALYPDRFAGLILVNPGGFSAMARWLPLFADAPLVLWLFRQPWFVRHVLPRLPLGLVFPDQASIDALLRWSGAHHALDLDHSGLRHAVRGITLPTQLIWGADDPILPRSTIDRIRLDLPHADVHVLDDAGHGPMREQPERFADAVLAFVHQLQPNRRSVEATDPA